MKIDIIESYFTSNCYVVHNDNNVYIIDPSVNVDEIKAYINKDEEVKGILLTHSHIDHIYYLNECVDYFKVKVYCSKHAKEIIENNEYNFAYEMGIDKKISLDSNASIYVKDNDIIDNLFKCIETPGHSIDSITYEIDDCLFTGDTLFDRSVGRSDLYSGDEEVLKASIKKLMALPDHKIYPGHGNSASLKMQLIYNYYVLDLVK